MDGRGLTDIRPLSAEVGIIPTAHGSGLFERGETQVLNVTTLGMPRMDQLLDTIGIDDKKRYMHHYNMPPVGQRRDGPGRQPQAARDRPRPARRAGPAAGRPLDRGVPLRPPAGVRGAVVQRLDVDGVGVRLDAVAHGRRRADQGAGRRASPWASCYVDGKYLTLTDILGAEDAFGDMDFKVAGTAEFVTALQLDTKIDGLPADVLGAALRQARDARLKILEVMHGAIAEPRSTVSDTAPKIVSLEIPIDKIGEVIGPKGKVINALQQETGADIAVDDDGVIGTVTIGAKDGAAVAEARRRIELILDPPKAEIGQVYQGRVVNITKFGAFVNILPGRDGLLHISKLGRGKRVEKVEDVVDLGDEVSRPGGRHRPAGQGVALAARRRQRAAEPALTAAASRPAGNGAEAAPSAPRPPAASASRRTGGRRGVVRGHLGRGGQGRVRRPRPGRVGRARRPAPARPRPPAQSPPPPVDGSLDHRHHPAGLRHHRRHRAHARRALGGGRLLGRHRVARRGARRLRRLALPRASALQGHRRDDRPGRSPRRSTRSAAT